MPAICRRHTFQRGSNEREKAATTEEAGLDRKSRYLAIIQKVGCQNPSHHPNRQTLQRHKKQDKSEKKELAGKIAYEPETAGESGLEIEAILRKATSTAASQNPSYGQSISNGLPRPETKFPAEGTGPNVENATTATAESISRDKTECAKEFDP